MQFVPCSTNSLPDEGHRYSRHLAYDLLAIWTSFGEMSSYQNHQLQKNYMSKIAMHAIQDAGKKIRTHISKNKQNLPAWDFLVKGC